MTHQALRAAKDQHGAMPAGLLGDVTEFAMPALADQACAADARGCGWSSGSRRSTSSSPTCPARTCRCTSPAPSCWRIYPVSAIADGQALNITVMSYAGSLRFGLVACRETCPDLGRMAQGLRLELDALLESRRAAARDARRRVARTSA